MALLVPTTTPATVGPLAKGMIFTSKRGTIAISTDAGVNADHYPLSEGMSLAVPAGETVTYWALVNGYGDAASLHYMPG